MGKSMVSITSIVAMFITLGICIILPLAVYAFYGVKNKGKGVWTAWLLGAAGFFVMQIIIRTPILGVVQMIPGFADFVKNNYLLYCGILAITASGVETVARVVVAKIMSKNLTKEKAFAAGLGHGGIEAIVLIGSAYLNNIIYSIMINTGVYDTLINQMGAADSTGATTASLELVRTQLVETESYLFLLAGYERILTMILHLALTLVVCYCIKEKKMIKGVAICMFVHTFVDFTSAALSGLSSDYLGNVLSKEMNYVIIYAFLTAVAVVSAIVVKRIMKEFDSDSVQSAKTV